MAGSRAVAVFKRLGLLLLSLVFLAGAGCAPARPEKKAAKPVPLILYFGDDQAFSVYPEWRDVVLDNRSLPQVVLTELLQGPQDPLLRPTFPAGTRLRGVRVAGGVAEVDFSRELRDKHPGGTAGERMTLDSLVLTLTELPGIDKVRLLIEGTPVESLVGHADLTDPLERPLFLGAFQVSPERARALQARVDGGRELWRANPMEVAHNEGGVFGFRARDRFELVEQAERGAGSGTGEATVEVTRAGQRYLVRLIQPVRSGPDGIWVFKSVRTAGD